ncbi:MAG: hypothetical protein ABIN48_10925, partial [Ginsengibacter sp.]
MRKILLALTSIFVLSTFAQAQKSWRLNNIPGLNADFSTLSDAVNSENVLPGDTIYIESSPNNYSGTIIKKRLIILGTGYFLSDVHNSKTQWNKAEATISGNLTFDPGTMGSVLSGVVASTIFINDSAIVIERSHISGLRLAYKANSFANNCVIRQNFFPYGGSITSQTATGIAKDVLFHNNIIGTSVSFAGNLDNSSAYFINNNFTYHNSFAVANCIFQNNIFFSPSFSTYLGSNAFHNNIANNTGIQSGNNNQLSVNLTNVYENFNNGSLSPTSGFSHDGRFVIKAGSPAIGAGQLNGTGIDCGAFGGPAPYVLSGMPPIPSIYKLTVPTQVN